MDSLLNRSRISNERRLEVVRAWTHVQNVVEPLGVGNGALRGALDDHVHAGKRVPGVPVGYLTSDLALLRPGRGRDKQCKRKQ